MASSFFVLDRSKRATLLARPRKNLLTTLLYTKDDAKISNAHHTAKR